MRFLVRFADKLQLQVFDQAPWARLRDRKGSEPFWIETEDVESKRTLSQNAHIQVLARILGDYTGESMKYERDRAVLNALGVEQGLGKPFIVLGQEYRPVRSTADLSKDEGAKVIDWLIGVCDSLELRVPPRPKEESEQAETPWSKAADAAGIERPR